MTLPLTEKQERIWRYIKSCKRSPTYREILRDLNYTSTGRLNEVIVSLRERGFVDYIPGRARSLVAIEPDALARFSTNAIAAEMARRLSDPQIEPDVRAAFVLSIVKESSGVNNSR